MWEIITLDLGKRIQGPEEDNKMGGTVFISSHIPVFLNWLLALDDSGAWLGSLACTCQPTSSFFCSILLGGLKEALPRETVSLLHVGSSCLLDHVIATRLIFLSIKEHPKLAKW